tara:strand:- start:521 stop:682 length:162 start_codon:yes stop_codon:yes gene_type:complete
MIKAIRILEVPLLLLTIAFSCMQEDSIATAVFLIVISVTRLVVNVITDSSIYK